MVRSLLSYVATFVVGAAASSQCQNEELSELGCDCITEQELNEERDDGKVDCHQIVFCQNLHAFPGADHYPPNLDCLFLSGHALGGLPAAEKETGLLALPQSLRRLDLAGCSLGELPASDPLGRLTELRVLNLEFNKLTKLSKSAFHGLSKLKVLWLTGNHFQPDEEAYEQMKALGNNLEELHEDQFRGLENLQVLLAHHNKLGPTLPDGVFRDQKQLKVLKLLDNRFVGMDRNHKAFTHLLVGPEPVLYQLDLKDDSGDDLEDYWEAHGSYTSDDFFLGPPPEGEWRNEL